MTNTPEDVDAMARIMAAYNQTSASSGVEAPMNPADYVPPPPEPWLTPGNSGLPYDAPVGDLPPRQFAGVPDAAGTDMMRNLLAKMNSFEGSNAVHKVSERLVESSKVNRPLREAMRTERTPRGARIGDWEIAVSDELGRKTYDVAHAVTGQPIASDLTLYEAAQALVNALNEGATINQAAVQDILKLEEEYARSRADALHFRNTRKAAEVKGDDHRMEIAEARYGEAVRRAAIAQGKLRSLTEGR